MDELLRSVTEVFASHEGFSSRGNFFIEQGPLITGLCAIFFTLIEVITSLRHRRRRKAGAYEHIRSVGLMLAIFIATALGLYSVHTKWMHKPQEIVWKEQIDQNLHRCLKNHDALSTEKRQEIQHRLAKIYESAQLHCLAYAMQRSSAAELLIDAHASAAPRFRVDVKFADAFLTVEGVSKILQDSFSIDDKRFLGYGYSLTDASEQYADAATHEYLIRNRCATLSSKKDGPCTDANAISQPIFTWILDPKKVAQDPNEKVEELLLRTISESNRESFASYLYEGRPKKTPPALIRFGKFPESYYAGTVGRPSTTYVFFSNLAEVWDKTFLEAEAASGRISPGQTASSPDLRVFIWVYYPSGNDDARMATWDYVKRLLKQEIQVDPEIAELAK